MSKAFGKIFELIRESNVLGQEPFNLFIDLRLFLSKNINNLTPASKSILVNQILSDGGNLFILNENQKQQLLEDIAFSSYQFTESEKKAISDRNWIEVLDLIKGIENSQKISNSPEEVKEEMEIQEAPLSYEEPLPPSYEQSMEEDEEENKNGQKKPGF